MSVTIPIRLLSVILSLTLVWPAVSFLSIPSEVPEVDEFEPLVPDDSSEIEEPKPLGPESNNVLLYYGNGGAAPPQLNGRGDFYDLKDYYDGLGFPTDYTNSWPSDLNEYRLIIFIMPGSSNDNGIHYFSSTQISELKDFMMNGGRLVVQGEHSGIFGKNTVNKLLGDLGVGIDQRPDNRLFYIEPAADDITDDQITDGVDELDMDGVGVSSLILTGTAKSLVRDRTGYDLVAVDQIAGAPSRPGADVVVYGDTQVLDDYQFANLDGDGIFDNYEFAYNLVWWKPANQPPVAVLQPSSVQTIYEGQSAYFSGYGSYDPDPVVDMVFVVDSSPSMPGEWNILSVILPQIEANLTAEGYDLEFVVLGLDHGTETPTKFPIMDAWLDYGARLDASGNIFQDCVRNTQISNPNGYNVNTANPSPGLIDPSKRCDHYSTHNSEGWAQGAAFVAENRTWREGATRIIVPIGDSAPWTQLGDGSPGKQFMGRPFVTYLDWLIIDETSEILNDNGVVAFPMYDESIDPDGAGPLVGVQQELFISMGEQTGGVAFPIDDAQGFMDNVIALIESVILQFSWDFDASVDLDLDGDYINDNEATGMNVSHTYYDDCDCVVTLTVTDVGGAWSQVQASVKVLNVAPSVQWSSRAEDGSALQPPYPEGMKVLFTSIVFDPGIYDTHTYDWDFGDGTILLDAGPSVTHAYGDNFTYVVVLKVTDDDGGIGIDDTPPLLTTNEDTVPSISVPFCIFLEGTYPCELIGEFTDPGWLDTHSGVWNFGDGEYETASITEENDPPDSTGISFTSHLYGDNGEFNVTFTVVDDDGGWGVASARVEILNLPPSSTVDVPSTVDEGDGFILGLVATDPGSDDIIVNIDWGDGDSEMETFYNDGVGPDPPNSGPGVFPFTIYANYSHVYGDDGNYTVTVNVRDDDGGLTIYATTIPVNNVAPTITPFGPFTVDEGSKLTLDATSTDQGSDDLTFIWEFEMGPTVTNIFYNDGTGPDPYPSPGGTYPFTITDTIQHTYGDNGAFNVTLTVEDDDGGSAIHTTTITVNNVAPTITPFGPFTVDEGSLLALDATANDLGSDDLVFTWDFEFGPMIASTYYNDGVGPDPYPSPGGTYPFLATDSISHTYGDNGVFNVTLTVEDDDGGSNTHTTAITVNNVAPTIASFGPFTVDEGSPLNLTAISTDQGSDDLTFIWELELGPTSTKTYYNDGTGPDPYPSPGGLFPFTATDMIEHTYGDNWEYNVTLTVEDDDGGSATYATTIAVGNVAPTVDVRAYVPVNFTLRIAGEKWHNVEIFIYEDGTEIGYAEVTRYPGNPDEQTASTGEVKCDITKTITAKVLYTPEDDPINGQPNGANPVWLTLSFEDGSRVKLKHTFNVQHPETWEWNVNINPYLLGHEISFEGTATDPGSDDLTFTWNWGDGTPDSETTYYNDGVGPDPYPSPDGTYPFTITDVQKHTFTTAGVYTVTLTVTDDDGGTTTTSLTIPIG